MIIPEVATAILYVYTLMVNTSLRNYVYLYAGGKWLEQLVQKCISPAAKVKQANQQQSNAKKVRFDLNESPDANNPSATADFSELEPRIKKLIEENNAKLTRDNTQVVEQTTRQLKQCFDGLTNTTRFT